MPRRAVDADVRLKPDTTYPMASPHSAQLLAVDGVTLQYRTSSHVVTATHRVSFSVARSDRFVILGPSGCGKSTILKAVAGFVKPVEGEILLNGAAVTRPGPDRVVVFQEFDQLLPWKTVKENITFALTASGRLARGEAEERAHHYIAKVKLTEFADSFPHTLSGGMKQRVAIARAMAMEPHILLMDEPFAALDALTRSRMQEELLQLWEETRFTILFVTHSISEAIRVGTRILLLSPHPGRVKAEIDSSGEDHADAEGLSLSARIHRLLFEHERVNAGA
jgi:NitT/TauT family transport system ATP-binding protein